MAEETNNQVEDLKAAAEQDEPAAEQAEKQAEPAAPAAPQVKAAVMPDPEPDPKEVEREYDEEIQLLQEEISRLDRESKDIRRLREKLVRQRDTIAEAKRQACPPPNFAQNIRQYLDTQQRLREQRADQSQAALERLGVRLNNRPAIDAVRQGRPGHGSGVKVHPLVQPPQ